MKTILITSFVFCLGTAISFAQSNMKTMEQEIKSVIENVEKAAAARNVAELEKLLHQDYRVVANRFKGAPGAVIIPKNAYLDMMKAGKIGGTTYKIEFKSLNITEHTAMAEVLYKAETSDDMHKYLFLIQDEDDLWRVVSDLPVVLN